MGVMGRDSILQNPVVGTSPRVCEPRVILKDIMPVGRLGHADVGSMSQNKKKSTGPVVLLEPLDSEVSNIYFYLNAFIVVILYVS